MLEKIARTISVALHPLIISLYATMFVMYLMSPWSHLPGSYKTIVVLLAGLGTSLVPLVISSFFVAMRPMKSFEMPTKSERILPILLSTISIGFTYYLLSSRISFPFPIVKLMEGILIMLIAATCITPFWKVSLHGMGAGAIVVYVFFVGLMSHTDFTIYITVTVLLSGLILWARLYLYAHTHTQMYIGFAVGFVSMGISMLR